MKFTPVIVAAALIVAMTTPVHAASPRFGLEFRVERMDAGTLGIASCLAIAKKASTDLRYVAMTASYYPNKLAVSASGPANGGGSLIVYCIAVDRKTAFVVQALDYNRAQSDAAKRAADYVHRALLRAR